MGFNVHAHRACFGADGVGIGNTVHIQRVRFVGSTRTGSRKFFRVHLHAFAQRRVAFFDFGDGRGCLLIGCLDDFSAQPARSGDVV